MKNIYFDIAATTPIDPKVLSHMNKIQESIFGNPSSIHRFGQEARAVIERARRQISTALNCTPKEIIFTGGGSESNNIALHGFLNQGDHLITSSYEHPAILKVAKELEIKGIEVSYVLPNHNGIVEVSKIEECIQENTKLISIMYVNNEMGTINPISNIVEMAKRKNIMTHTDAVQCFGKKLINMKDLNVDLLSASAHKFYGPKGVGFLYKKNEVKLTATLHGGGQELNLRPGTENIAGISGLGLATNLCYENMGNNMKKVVELEKEFLNGLKKNNIRFRLNGTDRLSGIMNITFFDISGQQLLMHLDLNNIAISFGSACSSGTMKESQILLETNMPASEAKNTVRISIGKIHTLDDVHIVVKSISEIIEKKNGK